MKLLATLALAALLYVLLRHRPDPEPPERDDPLWYAWRDTRPDSLVSWGWGGMAS